jgi:hypothetical protein
MYVNEMFIIIVNANIQSYNNQTTEMKTRNQQLTLKTTGLTTV